MHDIARYIDAQINLSTFEWGEVTQDEPIVRGDCNVLRISLDGEPPENALIYVRFINLLTHDSYGEISRALTDGMEIDIPQNKELFSSPGQIGAAFSIETETCRESCTYPIKISIIPLCCGNEYVGETGVVLIEDVYAAGEAAEEAAENANTAAAELRQAAINGDFDGQDGAPGQPGQPGEDGFSPIITVTDIEGGHRVTITDAQGTQYFDVLDGQGGGGAVSPTITVQDITGGHRLIITDVDGTKTVDVMDGAKGDKGDTGNGIASAVLNADYTLTLTFTDGTSYTTPPIRGATGATGADGDDGFSPTATVTKSGKVATISITDKAGTTTAQVSDGADGDDGYSPVASVSKSGKVATISITDKTGTTTATVSDGQDGSPGAPGADGFSPTIAVSTIPGGHRLTITDVNGVKRYDVLNGNSGNGIASIEKTGTSGLVDTYTITYTDETTTTFTVTNGQNGAAAGFGTPTATVDANVGTPSVSVTASGADTEKVFSFAFHNLKGQPGQNGTTPVKGTDYFTDAEIADIASEAASEVDALPSSTKYAAADVQGGAAKKTLSIPFGKVDSTSTSTAYTATIDGITELRDGVCAMIENGVATSAAGCTLNINNLGAKPIYQTMAAATAVTTTFNVNYTMLFVYNSTRVTGGCWDMFYGYNANTTYSNASLGQGYATCSTAEATAAKTASLSSYSLTTGGIVAVKFTNAVPANATLNVNSKGAKAIYFKGAAITAGVIEAGDTATFIYSTYYHLISIDRVVHDGADGNKTYICTNFDSAETYAVGDYAMYSSALYECTTAHTGAWNASHFTAVTLNEGDLICNTDENSSVAWSDITGKPTTLAGYGITDAEAKGKITINGTQKTASSHTLSWTDNGTTYSYEVVTV